jgi:hypothetical protein
MDANVGDWVERFSRRHVKMLLGGISIDLETSGGILKIKNLPERRWFAGRWAVRVVQFFHFWQR